MVSNIFDLAAARLAKAAAKPVVKSAVDNTIQIFSDCFTDVTGVWQQHIQANTLNRYFLDALKSVIGLDRPLSATISDLNLLATIETKLKMASVVFAPGASTTNPVGWLAGFQLGKHAFSSPEMASEAYARAFSILLFLHLTEVMKSIKQQT